MKCQTYGCNNEALKGAKHCAKCAAENWQAVESKDKQQAQQEYTRKQTGQQKHGRAEA